jgi:hypothetical protein
MEKAIKELAYLFCASRNTHPILVLGAGSSFRSGIPMAEGATRRIARAAYSQQILGADEDLGNPKRATCALMIWGSHSLSIRPR